MAQHPVTLADIVRGHVSLEIEGFDRLYLACRQGSYHQPLSEAFPRSKARPECGSKLAALADFLRGHTDSGALMRRLHPGWGGDRG